MKRKNKTEYATQTVVLADANQMQLTTLRHLLEEFGGYSVIGSFQSGNRALHFLESTSNLDILIVGCFLQDMDTIGFLDKLQQLHALQQCYVILTGPARYMQLVSRGDLSNMVDYYMIEPYNPDDLLKCVQMFTPAHCLPNVTPWDNAIHQALKQLGLSDETIGYWYIGGCLQSWLLLCHNGYIPQMKHVLIEVSRFYHVSSKGVESGVYRIMAQLKETGVIPADCVKAKAFFCWLANQIRAESTEKGAKDKHAQGFGRTTT